MQGLRTAIEQGELDTFIEKFYAEKGKTVPAMA
jgi:queuine/archaeosine tRNA-ribosyltransferase